MNGFAHNHYVPEWYQKRFMRGGKGKYFYLDLKPDIIKTNTDHTYVRNNLLHWGSKRCFATYELYTPIWRGIRNNDIEKFFFGKVDENGKSALEFFDDFGIKSGMQDAYHNLIRYMSVQKMRTPKGMAYIESAFEISNKNELLLFLQEIQFMFGAIWTDSVWQIANANNSDTKFIISDHPVTVYNRAHFPGSKRCLGYNDPDIREVATHTYFPISLEKIIILTNLSWVRDPYQKETTPHPNARLFRQTMFNATDVQLGRSLTEEEVLQINYITKRRAYRYIAAAEEEWLYPERRLKSTHWRHFGDGLLLMPEPRGVHMGGEIFVGYDDGRSEAFGEYGHRPGQRGYKDVKREERERKSLRRFQSEFALMQGRQWRGTPIEYMRNGPTQTDSEDYHKSLLSRVRDPKWLRKHGR